MGRIFYTQWNRWWSDNAWYHGYHPFRADIEYFLSDLKSLRKLLIDVSTIADVSISEIFREWKTLKQKPSS